MRKVEWKTILAVLVLISLLSVLTHGASTEADAYPDEAAVQVYVVSLTDVGNYRASNGSMVVDGALQATEVEEATVGYTFEGFTDVNVTISSSVVTEWNEYETLVETAGKVIIVNAHDEYLPVPNGYTKEEWTDQIADFMLNRQGTWVHTGGYPLYRVWFENGTKQEWKEGGFQRLMSHINKGNVTCWPPEGEEDKIATFAGGATQQLGLSWYWWNGQAHYPIGAFAETSVGRPLKRDDFKDYLIMPLYKYSSEQEDYWSGAVISFVNASDRYLNGHGVGAYVHIGVEHLYPGGYDDHGKGFIGTAAALWVESLRFDPSFDENSVDSIHGVKSRNSSLLVYPSISSVTYRYEDEKIEVRLEFAVTGLLQSKEDDLFYTEHVTFLVDELPANWSDGDMQVDLGYSKEGNDTGGLHLEGMYESGYGLPVSGLMWYGSVLTALAGGPVLKAILVCMGGLSCSRIGLISRPAKSGMV